MIVLCKKSYCGDSRKDYWFVKGEYSRQIQLEDEENNVSSNPPYSYIFIWYNSTHKYYYKGGIRFRFDKTPINRIDYGLPYFYDYFYDEKELRKAKLKKIENAK